MLSDFFRINLPYGMKKNDKGEWMFFNREYLPLGWNSKEHQQSIFANDAYAEQPIYTKYKGLSEMTLLKLAHEPNAVRRDSEGKIEMVFFYDDATNPQSVPQHWGAYFKKIELLSKSEVKRQSVI